MMVNSNKKYFLFNFFFLRANKLIIMNNFFFVVYFYNSLNLYLKNFLKFKNFYIYTFLHFNLLWYFVVKIFLTIFIKLNYVMCGFVYYKFFFKVGLGFRKKFCKLHNLYTMYVGGRHWAIFRPGGDFFFNVRRKNMLIFTQTKSSFNYYRALLKCLRSEIVFKMKGFILNRFRIRKKIPRSIIFARRIRSSKIKLKLSKKQKLI